ncbi:MAG: acetyl-CoA carboxylase biotin carboxylase subunit [Bacteroidetes bacterium]|jgi:acetyl-CoA carboxylase, biotin carboxylase subunit|nr:acetyl-CoA carboxylase biotin carboxylase subunit [Bacteroidota bacterium]MDA1382469.1 acetyl-CoA carboxylase biotin carboxylase subunit [Bacteroidota bacterium]
MFKKILIANRGEIALRVIRTCREMGIATVAVYSTADKDSLPVRFADEAVCIGPPKSAESYLNIPNIIAAAEITNADAIHPGYGFLSENSAFSRICRENDIKFIGASPEMIDSMGDKAAAKTTMKNAGVPTIPGSDGILETYEEAQKCANDMGYPIMIKATAGGGGKGMAMCNNDEELAYAWENTRREAAAAFGNDAMYMEKFIVEPRHIEIQIASDYRGKACHLSERDCSIQRRHQKLVEETPSPFITNKLREKMGEAAIKAAEAVKYEGVGTVEFLVDANRDFYFMEMNTRIQVEHTITEEVINYDLVKEQIKLAAREKISGRNHFPTMHAIQCRINAEDPDRNFAPCPGTITHYNQPGGHGVRIDTHVYAGYRIPPYYDSMIAKLIVVAQTREEAITKMGRALDEYIIEGVKTTIPFHQRLMKNEKFRSGNFTTKFLEEEEI